MEIVLNNKFRISKGFRDRMVGEPVLVMPQCLQCTYWEEPGIICAAFPEGIPKEVLMNIVDHKNPVSGDHGIRFAPRK